MKTFRTVALGLSIGLALAVALPHGVQAARTLIINSSLNSNDIGNNWQAVDTVLGALIEAGTAVTSTAAELNIVDGVTATAAELNLAADLSAKFEAVTETNTLTAAECGKTMTLNSTTEFSSTLPALTAGCTFTFVVAGAPSGDDYNILSNGGSNIIVALVNELDTDTGDDGPYTTTADTVTFVDGTAVQGDWLECTSDGTNWYCRGTTNADGGITFSQS